MDLLLQEVYRWVSVYYFLTRKNNIEVIKVPKGRKLRCKWKHLSVLYYVFLSKGEEKGKAEKSL